MQLSPLPSSGEGTTPLGCCALGNGLAPLWSPEKQGLILFSLRVVQLLSDFPGVAKDSWSVTQHHHLGQPPWHSSESQGVPHRARTLRQG